MTTTPLRSARLARFSRSYTEARRLLEVKGRSAVEVEIALMEVRSEWASPSVLDLQAYRAALACS